MSERPLPQRQAELARLAPVASRRSPGQGAPAKPTPPKPAPARIEITGLDDAIAAALALPPGPPARQQALKPALVEVEPEPEADQPPAPEVMAPVPAPKVPLPTPAAASSAGPSAPPVITTPAAVAPSPAAPPPVRAARVAPPAADAGSYRDSDDGSAGDGRFPRRHPSVALRVAVRVLLAACIGVGGLLAVAYLPGAKLGGTALRSTLPDSGIAIPDPLIPPARQ